jgi:cytochrome b561
MKDITRFSSILYGSGARRYTSGAQAFHWITALLMFVIIPAGWIFAEFKTKAGSPDTFEAPFPGSPLAYASVHKTLGLAVFAMPGRMAMWEKGLSHASHWLLYAILLVMPISGYVMSSASTKPISIFYLFDFPKLPVDKEMAGYAKNAHLYVQWAVYVLIALHVAATAYHLIVKRDGLLDRMLPRQRNAD